MSSKYSTSELHSPSFCTEDLHLRMCKKIADLTRVVDKLFRQYYEQSSHYSSLKKKHHLQKLENEELKQDKQTDLNKIETCRKEIEDLRRENSQLSEEISVLKRKVSCAEFEKTMLLEESEQLKQTLRDVRDKMNEMQNKLNELCEQRTACCGHVELIEALEKKVYKQSCEFDQLSKDKQSQDSNYIDLQNRYKLASEENVLLKSRLEEFKSSLDNLQEEKQSLQIQITQLLKELQEYKSSLEHLQGAKRASSIRKKKAPTFHPKREYWLQKPPKVGVAMAT